MVSLASKERTGQIRQTEYITGTLWLRGQPGGSGCLVSQPEHSNENSSLLAGFRARGRAGLHALRHASVPMQQPTTSAMETRDVHSVRLSQRGPGVIKIRSTLPHSRVSSQ